MKHNKCRLILDESISFGTIGRTGRGLTKLYNVPVSVFHVSVCNELTACRTDHGNGHAGGFGLKWPEMIARILRWLEHRRGSPAHQLHLIPFLRRGPGSSCSLRL